MCIGTEIDPTCPQFNPCRRSDHRATPSRDPYHKQPLGSLSLFNYTLTHQKWMACPLGRLLRLLSFTNWAGGCYKSTSTCLSEVEGLNKQHTSLSRPLSPTQPTPPTLVAKGTIHEGSLQLSNLNTRIDRLPHVVEDVRAQGPSGHGHGPGLPADMCL